MKITLPLLVPLLLTAAACAPDQDGTLVDAAQLTAPVYEVRADQFMTHVTGAEEVPARDTRAQGQAVFRLSEDGSMLRYRLIVANIENVTQAHIHLAPRGQNGGVVAWLYPSGPPAQLIPGRSQGVLAEGDITGANLVGALAGQDLTALIDAITTGDAYVNVHTSTFPGGEIRGQLH